MKTLWTFDTQPKLEEFVSVLKNHDIAYEIASKGDPHKPINHVTVAVEERNFEKAKKLLLKHRKRRTSRDFSGPLAPSQSYNGH